VNALKFSHKDPDRLRARRDLYTGELLDTEAISHGVNM
jgi:hypothetical protein